MLKKDAAKEVVALVEGIQSQLDAVSNIYRAHGSEEDQESYRTTVEFLTGYLHQDIVHPILLDHPDLAPDNWSFGDDGQWVKQAGN